MNIGFDLDYTVTKNPEFFKKLAWAWHGMGFSKVCIITGRPDRDREITLAELRAMGVPVWVTVHFFNHDYIYSKHLDAYFEVNGTPIPLEEIKAEIAAWKVKKCKELGIEVYFEDDALCAEELKKSGVYVCHVDSGQ